MARRAWSEQARYFHPIRGGVVIGSSFVIHRYGSASFSLLLGCTNVDLPQLGSGGSSGSGGFGTTDLGASGPVSITSHGQGDGTTGTTPDDPSAGSSSGAESSCTR